ncbi:PREDICTED: kinesin-like protein KIN-UB [Camelina sativa]|uniref:Kinesin-like protein n=1 Tax=Camelina sativa TaxID=90675 RepID=A0ABM1QW01_CAMSA|nr:PREDICTED: kinesin-like protein KIN-UB [Camelina sativa]
MAMASSSSRNGAVRGGSMRPVSGSSNLRSSSFKSRIPSSSAPRRNSTSSASLADNGVPGRVRVAVRLRPRNADESVADADFADCVELQPELKRLKLRKNNWDTETYEFDDVLTEAASQKRVYQVVAKPVVESVLEGYNGTVMAYGQTGTGKTFTLGRLGDEDTAARGIMVRSMEDIIAGTSLDTDSVSVSYLQLYMETIQDLLDPSNDNIAIVEDPKTGDVSLPGATHVEIRNQQNFLELLQLGETHRVAANTKLNTESSRSHAILMVHVKRSVVENEDPVSTETENSSHFLRPSKPLVRRSKLVLVDLAGSERVHKSGINLMRRCLDSGAPGNSFSGTDSLPSRHSQARESLNGQKAPFATLCEQVGLQKILQLLESDDANIRIHAVKVVANLAAEEANQEKIVEAGGLTSLLMLLRSYEDETVRRVAAGAIANLAMNEVSQQLIVDQGGISLLSLTAADAEDPQTLRMVAGAIANLCGNDKLQARLWSDGGIKALLGMVRCGHPDVLAQVARGIANFAKCESRATTQGVKSGRSLLIEDGALPWIVQHANDEAAPIRRHIELALCHLAQHEVNAKEMISGGALWELVRISKECSREDIRSLAHRTLSSSPVFRSEIRRLGIQF